MNGTPGRYEASSGRTFKMTGNPLERLLSTWAKFSDYALRTTDEAQKGGIRAETQRGIDELKARGLLAEDALPDYAMETARQRTLQNDGDLAKASTGLRSALNHINLLRDSKGGSFGVGDFALPFARVPANAVAQAANYNPVGLANGIKNVGRVLLQAKNGTLTPEMQAKAVRDVGRGLTGSALLGVFAGLALGGVISVAESDDPDKEALERAEGKTGTQLNLSALQRLLAGEDTTWREGDALMNIGFLEPINAIISLGALIADEYREDRKVSPGEIVEASLSSIAQALFEMPAMSQINDVINSYTYSDAQTPGGRVIDTILGTAGKQASSFLLPNVIRGIATGLDDTIRNTYTGGELENAINYAIAGVPIARETLPASLDNFGRERTYTGNALLDLLNANINPGQITTYKQDKVGAELERLYEATGNTGVYPKRKAPNSITVDGEKLRLNAEEKDIYQRTYGQSALRLISDIITLGSYQNSDNEGQGKMISLAYEYAAALAKSEISDYQLDGWMERAAEAEQDGIDPADYIVYHATDKDTDGSGAVSIAEYAAAVNRMFSNAGDRETMMLLQYPEWAEKAEERNVPIGDYIQYKSITAGADKKEDKIQALQDAGMTWYEANRLYTRCEKTLK